MNIYFTWKFKGIFAFIEFIHLDNNTIINSDVKIIRTFETDKSWTHPNVRENPLLPTCWFSQTNATTMMTITFIFMRWLILSRCLEIIDSRKCEQVAVDCFLAFRAVLYGPIENNSPSVRKMPDTSRMMYVKLIIILCSCKCCFWNKFFCRFVYKTKKQRHTQTHKHPTLVGSLKPRHWHFDRFSHALHFYVERANNTSHTHTH